MKRGAPIIAEYLGGAVNCDAYHLTDPRSDGMGVSACITKSLQDAGVAPEEVSLQIHAQPKFYLSSVLAKSFFVMRNKIFCIGHVVLHYHIRSLDLRDIG